MAFFARDKIQICGHFFVHRCSSSFSLTKNPPCCKQGGKFRCTTYLLRTIIRAPGNGGGPARLTAKFSPRLGRDIRQCATGAGLAPSPARFGVCARLTGSVSACFILLFFYSTNPAICLYPLFRRAFFCVIADKIQNKLRRIQRGLPTGVIRWGLPRPNQGPLHCPFFTTASIISLTC